MMGHKVCFYTEICIIIPKLSLLPILIWNTETVTSKLHHNKNSATSRQQVRDLDETAHFQMPQLDVHCLQIQIVSFFVW